MVGLGGFEPPTSPLSGVRSNHLSYRPKRGLVASCFAALLLSSRLFRSDNGLWLLAPGQGFIKEVIQPQVPLRLPCYDFTPVMNHTVVSALLAVRLPTSGATHSHGVTGGVYKARERIHRSLLFCDY